MTELKGLPNKELFRVEEVARYFDVTERTIRLWIQHGHLKADKVVGSYRVTRPSIARCRFGNRYQEPVVRAEKEPNVKTEGEIVVRKQMGKRKKSSAPG